MPIDARIALQGQQPQINIPMNPAEIEMAGMQLASGRNKLMADNQAVKRDSDLNRLYSENYKNGGLDYQSMAGQAAQMGYGAEIPGLLKGQNDQVASEAEAKKLQIEKQLGLYRTMAQLMSGVKDEASLQSANQQALQILGPEAEQGLMQSYDPEEVDRRYKSMMTMEEQLKQEYQKTQQAIAMRGQDITVRGQNISDSNADASRSIAARNSNIAAEGLGLRRQQFDFQKQNKLTGSNPVTSKNALLKPQAGKALPTGQAKQVIGAKNLGAAVDEYVSELNNFGVTDLVSPDSRAAMGTKYNNMMLQAKEAYNLGVLNGPDYKILTDVVTDPASMKGAITSNKALGKQALELKRMMGTVSKNAGETQMNGSSAQTDAMQINSDDDYNALPSGAVFIDPNGNKRRKP